MTEIKPHKARPFEDRVAEIDEQIAILEGKRRRLCGLWVAKVARGHDGLAGRARVLAAQVDAGMWETVPAVVREIVRMANARQFALPTYAVHVLTDAETAEGHARATEVDTYDPPEAREPVAAGEQAALAEDA
jgi:hypothetical protein